MSHHHGGQSHYFHKPENALRRARELQSISPAGDTAALTLLHDVLSHRRHKTWSPSYESVMLLYLDLCLKKNKFREAKDGLHQYRNVSQSQAPGSLEIVIKYLMEKAELKCKTAKECAEEMAVVSSAGDGDVVTTEEDEDDIVDDVTTHQSILLSTMSLDPEKTQRETAVVLPSLKFLWETYRAILDILRSNSKLEHLYHSAAIRALEFCKEYNRRMEFRRLCDMLRMHLGNLQKYGSAVSSNGVEDGTTGTTKMNSKVRGWEGWTMESIELHLQTRFIQLETATHLHLYTEGFRTVEDIYTILQIPSSPTMMASLSKGSKTGAAVVPVLPKAKLMATYYEKLTTLFWVSKNYLFHAFAWYKYYTLCEYNRGMNKETKAMQASMVLLSALCIPEQAGSKNATKPISQLNEEETVSREKMARMATLLGFHTKYPTREALLYEITSKNMTEDIPVHIQQLYELLEDTNKKNNPLKLFENARPLLKELLKSEDLAKYVKPLSHVLLLKLIVHLSSAYYTVSLPFLRELTCSSGGTSQDDGEEKKDGDDVLNLSFQDVERAIVLFAAQKTTTTGHTSQGGGKSSGNSSSSAKSAFSVKIDHKTQSLRFIPNATSSQWEQGIMRYQLTTLAKSLSVPAFTKNNKCNITIPDRTTKYKTIRENLPKEHANILERKNTIEKRKEEVERLAREKLRVEHARKVVEESKRKKEEALRLDRERKLREAERAAKIQKELEFVEKKKFLKALGKEVVDEKELEKVDTDALAKEHAAASNKKKEDAERKKNEKAKKLDYLVRATRIEEIPLVKKIEEETLQKEKVQYEIDVVDKVQNAKSQWEADVKAKDIFSSYQVFSQLSSFEDVVMARRESLHTTIREQVHKDAETDAKTKKQQRAHCRKVEDQKQHALEEKQRKEEERLARDEEERLVREEEKQRKEVEEEKKRQAELLRMSEEREKKEREKILPPAPPMSNDLDGQPPRTGGSISSRFGNISSSDSNSRISSGYKGDRHTPGAGSRFDRDRESSTSRFGDSSRSARSGDRESSSRFNDRESSSRSSNDRPRESSSRFGDRESSSRFGDRNSTRESSSRFDRDNRDGDKSDRNSRPPPEPKNSRWT